MTQDTQDGGFSKSLIKERQLGVLVTESNPRTVEGLLHDVDTQLS